MPMPAHANDEAARECAAIAADLQRLNQLIGDAGRKLLTSFNALGDRVPELARDASERAELCAAVGGAITALQFQDMATQLTQHAQRRLEVLMGCIGEAGDPLFAITRAQPVRQVEMKSGSIELF